MKPLKSDNFSNSAKTINGFGGGISIDGFRRRGSKNSGHPTRPKPQIAKPVNKTMHHKVQKSKTLIRNAVTKPISPLSSSKSGSTARLFNRISANKNSHAKQIPQNQSVNRFGFGRQPVLKITANMPLVKPPEEKTPSPPPPIFKLFTKQKTAKPQVFEHRIAKATNHLNQPKAKPKLHHRIAKKLSIRPRYVVAAGICILLLGLGGYFAYVRVPAVAIQVADNRAGFEGRLPSDVPSGFDFRGPIEASRGIITIRYLSNSDQRNFAITQKPTNWSSEALLSNFIIKSHLQYQTYHDKGLTIYIYNEGSATWVDRGIWYSLSGQSQLSSDQILSIASSM